jgi:hypothetical protein
MNAARHLAVALVAVSSAPALADDGPEVTHAEQLVVVTPHAPVVITSGPTAGGPSTVAPAAAPAAANGAPQNEGWNDVSHINGTLVKVGERSDYILRYRKTNIASNPIGWLMGFYGVSVSHAVHPNVAVRVDANLMNVENSTGYEVGASLPIYFRRVYSGPFIEPGLITRGSKSNYDYAAYCDYGCGDSSYSMVGPEMLVGWHWTFDSGLNVAAAFGLARNMTARMDEYHYESEIEPAGYFRIGYAF